MRREDCVDVFKRVPEVMHAQCNLVLRNQVALAIDTIIRYEPAYMLIRGREGGTTDEGRSFFVPFEDIAYIKVERILKVGDLKRMYGETSDVDEDKLAPKEEKAGDTQADVQTPAPTPAPSMDPASIAKQNLLDRIRATRTSAFGSGGRPGLK